MKSLLFCAGSFVGALFFSFPATIASTPDGETPAMEHVCDGYAGAAYGLCNAYCEAMDCDDDPNADQEACDKVEDKFEARTGKNIPCGGATCADFDFFGKGPMQDLPADGTLQCKQAPSTSAITCMAPDNTVWECYPEKDGCAPLTGCTIERK
jgi:hypothetical protein